MSELGHPTLFLDLDGTVWNEQPVRDEIEAHLTSEQARELPRIAARLRRENGYYTWNEVYGELGLDYTALLTDNAELIRLPPGNRKALQRLAVDWRIWITTDGGSSYTRFKLDRLSIIPFIIGALTSDLLGAMKADRHWWRRAIETAGCGPNDAAAVGDSLCDVRIPLELGMLAIWVTDNLEGSPPLSGLARCRTLAEVPSLLRRLDRRSPPPCST